MQMTKLWCFDCEVSQSVYSFLHKADVRTQEWIRRAAVCDGSVVALLDLIVVLNHFGDHEV